MIPIEDSFFTAFLLGFLTNLWVAALALIIGTLIGAPLAWLRFRSKYLRPAAVAATGILRASPAFVVMFCVLNIIPDGIGISDIRLALPETLALVLSLSVVASTYIADALFDSLQHFQRGSVGLGFRFLPNMLRAYTSVVLASPIGAAIGVPEAVTVTLHQADRLQSTGSRIALVVAVIVFFVIAMGFLRRCADNLQRYLDERMRGDIVDIGLRATRQFWLDRTTQYGIIPTAVVAVLVGAIMIAPAPPSSITIETGPVGGSWYAAAEKYRDYLELRGILVKLRPRLDTSGIPDDVNQAQSDTQAGFMAAEGDRDATPEIATLGNIDYQPLFGFARTGTGLTEFSPALKGHRIVLPPRGSTSVKVALPILASMGITEDNTPISFVALQDEEEALRSGAADAGFVMLTPDNSVIRDLAQDAAISLMNFPQAAAIASRFPGLRTVSVPAATFDLISNVPPSSLTLIASTSAIVVRKDLHPVIVYMLMDAMSEAHRPPTVVSRDGEFPAPHHGRLPISEYASDYYKSGVPWIYRSLPLWLSSVVAYYFVLLVPLVVLMPLYNWLSLPNVPEILQWLRSVIWLRILRDMENNLDRGQKLTRGDQATLRLIRTSLQRLDKTSECQQTLNRVEEKRRSAGDPEPQRDDVPDTKESMA